MKTQHQIAEAHFPQLLLELVSGGDGFEKQVGQPLNLALIREKLAAELARKNQP